MAECEYCGKEIKREALVCSECYKKMANTGFRGKKPKNRRKRNVEKRSNR